MLSILTLFLVGFCRLFQIWVSFILNCVLVFCALGLEHHKSCQCSILGLWFSFPSLQMQLTQIPCLGDKTLMWFLSKFVIAYAAMSAESPKPLVKIASVYWKVKLLVPGWLFFSLGFLSELGYLVLIFVSCSSKYLKDNWSCNLGNSSLLECWIICVPSQNLLW